MDNCQTEQFIEPHVGLQEENGLDDNEEGNLDDEEDSSIEGTEKENSAEMDTNVSLPKENNPTDKNGKKKAVP